MIIFPVDPIPGQQFAADNGVIYVWDGDKWVASTAGGTWAGATGATGAQGATGPQGASGPAGATGPQGATGVTGPEGATGATGVGSEGATGPQGATGVTGPDGATGATGIGSEGATGPQGATGVTGPEGATGAHGATGATGPEGASGATGPEGASGATGPAGTSVTIIGSVPDVYVNPPNNPQTTLNAAFPSATTGNGVIDSNTGDLWVYDGAVWNNVGTIKGPQGATGATGAGIDGATGATGVAGTDGATGATGVAGTDGATGATGIGIDGATGPQGATGVAGTDGATGATGVGVQGATGPQGATGVIGPDGATGATGVGVQGATGPQGATGVTGPQGATGVTGATGSFSGNLASNIDGQGYSISNVATITTTGNISGTFVAPGSNTQVLFNDTGVISANTNLTFDKATSTLDVNGLIVAGTGTPLGGLTNPTISAVTSANNYVQIDIYNANIGNAASSDFIAYPNNGTDASGWIDVGITSNTFSQAAYTVTGQNEGYVFMSSPSGAGKSGNLVIATDSTGTTNSIEFYVGGFNQTKGGTTRKLLITSTGANVVGNLAVSSGNITGNTNGFAVGYRDIPQVSFAANATTALTDAGKHYYSTSASNLTLTIANNDSVGFATGATINIINQGTGNITIAQGVGVTMYTAGNATSSNRTLTTYGVASITKVATDTWFLSGVGLV